MENKEPESNQQNDTTQLIKCIGVSDILETGGDCDEMTPVNKERCDKCELRASRIMHHHRMMNRR